MGTGYSEGDVIEWNHKKIADYFAECGKIYDTFEDSINEVSIALNDFVNDGEELFSGSSSRYGGDYYNS